MFTFLVLWTDSAIFTHIDLNRAKAKVSFDLKVIKWINKTIVWHSPPKTTLSFWAHQQLTGALRHKETQIGARPSLWPHPTVTRSRRGGSNSLKIIYCCESKRQTLTVWFMKGPDGFYTLDKVWDTDEDKNFNSRWPRNNISVQKVCKDYTNMSILLKNQRWCCNTQECDSFKIPFFFLLLNHFLDTISSCNPLLVNLLFFSFRSMSQHFLLMNTPHQNL